MNITPATIPDILIIEPKVHQDTRGFFLESFHETLYNQAGISLRFVQDNHSGSKQGVLRGLHYQINHPQGKLINVIHGNIFDVSVDLRHRSTTFKQWFGIQLNAEDHKYLWIPPGFAHGFYVLSTWAEILYKTTDYYSPENERTLLWNDPEINIDWQLVDNPILSAKDLSGLRFSDAQTYDL